MTSFSNNPYAPLTDEIMQSWRKQQERKLGRTLEAHEYNPAFTQVISALEESGGRVSTVPPEFRKPYEQENSKTTDGIAFGATLRHSTSSVTSTEAERPPLKALPDPRKKAANRKKSKAARAMRKAQRRRK